MTNRQAPKSVHIEARVSSLETAVEGLHEDLGKVNEGLWEIQNILRANAKTDWNIILAAIVVVMGFWAATIRPLSNEMDTQKAQAASMALAVLEQNKSITELHIQQAVDDARAADLKEDVSEIKAHGDPLTDNRLTAIEEKIGIPNRSAMGK